MESIKNTQIHNLLIEIAVKVLHPEPRHGRWPAGLLHGHDNPAHDPAPHSHR